MIELKPIKDRRLNLFLDIEAWADDKYEEAVFNYAFKLIEEYAITKEDIADYKSCGSHLLKYSDNPIEISLLDTIIETLEDREEEALHNA